MSDASAGILATLSDAQAFSRDPEDFTQEAAADTIARLAKHVARQRKARQDDAAFKAEAARMKKANAASKKKKAKPAATPADIGDITL
jgi:hypothetical protein